MKIEDVKKNLNKNIKYKDTTDIYKLTACIIRKGNDGYFYQAEIHDKVHGNSVIICRLEEIEVIE